MLSSPVVDSGPRIMSVRWSLPQELHNLIRKHMKPAIIESVEKQ